MTQTILYPFNIFCNVNHSNQLTVLQYIGWLLFYITL